MNKDILIKTVSTIPMDDKHRKTIVDAINDGSGTTALESKIDQEVKDRKEAVAEVDKKIVDLKTQVDSKIVGDVAAEAALRDAADQALTKKIDDHVADANDKFLNKKIGGTIDGDVTCNQKLTANTVTVGVGSDTIEITSSGITKSNATEDAVPTGTNKWLPVGKSNGLASLDANGNIPLTQLGNVDNHLFEIVDALPTDVSTINTKHIYLVISDPKESNDTYSEYVYVGDTSLDYDASKWEKFGTFKKEVDLTDYARLSVDNTFTANNNFAAGVKTDTIASIATDNTYQLDGTGLTVVNDSETLTINPTSIKNKYIDMNNRRLIYRPSVGKAIKLEDLTIGDENDFSYVKLNNVQVGTTTTRGTITIQDTELRLRTSQYNSVAEIGKERIYIQNDGKNMFTAKETGLKFGEDKGVELIPSANNSFYKVNGEYDAADSVSGYLAPMAYDGTALKIDNKFLNVGANYADAKDTDLLTKADINTAMSQYISAHNPVITSMLSVRLDPTDKHGCEIHNNGMGFTTQANANVYRAEYSTSGVYLINKTTKDILTAQKTVAHIGTTADSENYTMVCPIKDGLVPVDYIPTIDNSKYVAATTQQLGAVKVAQFTKVPVAEVTALTVDDKVDKLLKALEQAGIIVVSDATN